MHSLVKCVFMPEYQMGRSVPIQGFISSVITVCQLGGQGCAHSKVKPILRIFANKFYYMKNTPSIMFIYSSWHLLRLQDTHLAGPRVLL